MNFVKANVIKSMRERGKTYKEIASVFKVSVTAVRCRYEQLERLNRNGIFTQKDLDHQIAIELDKWRDYKLSQRKPKS
jgi:DNA invertase Pin-like site-specific DNA recombinase